MSDGTNTVEYPTELTAWLYNRLSERITQQRQSHAFRSWRDCTRSEFECIEEWYRREEAIPLVDGKLLALGKTNIVFLGYPWCPGIST